MITKIEDYIKYLTESGSYWGSKAAGILPFCSKTKKFLIGFRSGYVNEPYTWGTFGGKFDYGDTKPESVAKRELHEETGFDGNITLQKLINFEDDEFIYYNFLGIVTEEFTPTLNWENDKYQWITYDKLINLQEQHFGLKFILKNNREYLKSISQKEISKAQALDESPKGTLVLIKTKDNRIEKAQYMGKVNGKYTCTYFERPSNYSAFSIIPLVNVIKIGKYEFKTATELKSDREKNQILNQIEREEKYKEAFRNSKQNPDKD